MRPASARQDLQIDEHSDHLPAFGDCAQIFPLELPFEFRGAAEHVQDNFVALVPVARIAQRSKEFTDAALGPWILRAGASGHEAVDGVLVVFTKGITRRIDHIRDKLARVLHPRFIPSCCHGSLASLSCIFRLLFLAPTDLNRLC